MPTKSKKCRKCGSALVRGFCTVCGGKGSKEARPVRPPGQRPYPLDLDECFESLFLSAVHSPRRIIRPLQ